MKRFSEYAEIEIRQMNEEQVNLLVDRECALEGIALLPPAPVDPVKPDLSHLKKEAYKVGSYWSSNAYYFETAEQAQRVKDALRANGAKTLKDISGAQYLCAFREDDEQMRVASIEVMSEQDAIHHSAALKQYETQEKEYNQLKKAYDRIQSDRKGISDEIWAVWLEQQEVKSNLVRLEAELARYTQLADGNQKIARTMLTEIWNKSNPTSSQVKALTEFEAMMNAIEREHATALNKAKGA